jgi:hypothetical protein
MILGQLTFNENWDLIAKPSFFFGLCLGIYTGSLYIDGLLGGYKAPEASFWSYVQVFVLMGVPFIAIFHISCLLLLKGSNSVTMHALCYIGGYTISCVGIVLLISGAVPDDVVFWPLLLGTGGFAYVLFVHITPKFLAGMYGPNENLGIVFFLAMVGSLNCYRNYKTISICCIHGSGSIACSPNSRLLNHVHWRQSAVAAVRGRLARGRGRQAKGSLYP